MVSKLRRNAFTPLRTTIQYSSAVLLFGCASSIDATKDIQTAHAIAKEHLSIEVDSSLMWQVGEPLTSDAAIAYAIAQDALLQRDLAIIVQRRAEISQAELPANPTFSGAFGIAVDGLTGAPIILQGVQSLSWLWTRPDKIASAEQTLQQAILTAANRTVGVVATVRIAHHEVSTLFELVRLAELDKELASKMYEITLDHASVGEASKLDVDQAKISTLETEHSLLEAQEQFDIAMLELLHVMGCPEVQQIPYIVPPIEPDPIQHSEEVLFAFAIEHRLDLATQRAMIEQRSSELGLANPPLVTGSVMFNESFGDREGILPGGGITIALDGNAKEAVADSKLKQSELQYLDAMRTAVKEVRSLFEAYSTSIEKFEVDSQLLQVAQSSLDRAENANSQGELHPLSLLPMKRKVIEAKQHVLKDTLLISTQAIKLEQSVGGSLKGINP